MILAAGVARRYGSLKQLEPMGPGGEALLEYSAFDAWRAGFGRVVLVVRPETEEQFRATVGARIHRRIPVRYAWQTLEDLPTGFSPPSDRCKPWGTAQAVLATEKAILDIEGDGLFAVINADDFYGRESYVAASRFLAGVDRSAAVFAMPGFELVSTLTDAGPVSRALCQVDDDRWLEDIVEWHDLVQGAALAGLVSMNMWCFTRVIFDELRRLFVAFLRASRDGDAEFLLPDAVRTLIRERRARVKVLNSAGTWCGVTFREDRQRVVRTLAETVSRGEYPEDLWDVKD